eukprot:TRINITY_DN18517_c0_g1_i1.p1 TRINITY_DN18517_c0_g1~~TRINITY_DN18517_c0_g1_i1.p1  ORF type:complete len:226 (+),score=8.76 TRINITY_DN18517_c0_g1_i1:91-768(+)
MASERAVLNDARDSALSEGKTYVVMSNGTADFKTVTDALRHCCEGDTILVKLGQYDEKIVLEKNVTIQGDSGTEPTDIIINGGAVCKVGGVIRGVAITSLVEIRSGSVTLEGCDISEGFDGIKICKGANPTILRCVIHNARQGGDCIYVAEGAKALIEDNEIHNARVNGIHVCQWDSGCGAPTTHPSGWGGQFGVVHRPLFDLARILGGEDAISLVSHGVRTGLE